MQQYEYLILYEDGNGKVTSVNGVATAKPTGSVFRYPDFPTVEVVLNDLGTKGWEAVGLVTHREVYLRILLKRPIS